MATKKRPITWYELKQFCNTLTGDQLGTEVIVWCEEGGFSIQGIQQLEDDFFNPSGECMEPVGIYRDTVDWDEVKDEPILMRKGDPVLLSDEHE